MDVAIYTLGCKVNQYETQAMESELRRRGYVLVPFDGKADIYIINTCTVTASGDHKSRQAIRRCRKWNPDALIAVCGCYAQMHTQEAASLGADLVAGSDNRLGFLDEIERLAQARPAAPVTMTGDIMSARILERLPAGGLDGHTRALLKVEDGCTNFCTYCTIPYARGPVRSLPRNCAVQEAKRLAGEGYRELVIVGVEISSWGQDFRDGSHLIDLLEDVCTAAPECRIRLGSLEPRTVTEEFCRRAAMLPNLCEHFHLSLQSGCDDTLRRMHRRYSTAQYAESVRMLREAFERPSITTDLIVGFPGESEEEFAQTLEFLQKCAFTAVHIFPYSRRYGVPAADMPGQVCRAEKEARAKRASAVAEEMRQKYLQDCLGRRVSVLFEEEDGEEGQGYARNYVRVRARGVQLRNQERWVRVTGVCGNMLEGVL